MAGLEPAIQLVAVAVEESWMGGSSPPMVSLEFHIIEIGIC
jgi:hypothetical protein